VACVQNLDREYDIALYGATGFVGGLTAAYLAKAAPTDVRIALAGRSQRKLEAVRAGLGPAAENWAIVLADATDQSSLDALAASARSIVSTVGPYTEHGLPLVAACAAAGTDYADLTGESLFVRRSIDGYHKQAADTTARIVHSCGFDSVPSDLSVHALYRRALADDAGELRETTLVVRRIRGGVSGGTAASGLAQLREMATDPAARRLAVDPYTLSPVRAAEPELGRQSDGSLRRAAGIDRSLSGWTAGFFMGPYNTRIVRRSNAIRDFAYGREFRYSEVMSLGRTPFALVPAAVLAGGLTAGVALSPLLRFVPHSLLARLSPRPGTGPSERSRAKGFFAIETFATTSSGRRYRARFAMQGDPGYAATAVLLGESALALALDTDRLSRSGGVLTPATAMGDPLLDRLVRAGVDIQVDELVGAAAR